MLININIYSGGWDNTVQIWDLRAEYSVRSFYGPHICGDGVDLKDDKILTGSYRPDKNLQLWDFKSGKLINEGIDDTEGLTTEGKWTELNLYHMGRKFEKNCKVY